MSKAFDTIRRDRLMHTLETFLDDSELCVIHLLLTDTTVEPRLAKGRCMQLRICTCMTAVF